MRKSAYLITSLFLIVGLFLFHFRAEARPFLGRTLQLPLQKIAPGTGKILIDFSVPLHHEFAYEAPSTIWIRVKDTDIIAINPNQKKASSLDLSKLPYSVNYKAAEGQTVIAMDIRGHFCDKDTQVCLTDTVRVKFPVRVKKNAPTELKIKIPLRSKISS